MTRFSEGLDPHSRRPKPGACWEPEPLHLPAVLPSPRERDNADGSDGDDEDSDRDLPGSHVTVIEL